MAFRDYQASSEIVNLHNKLPLVVEEVSETIKSHFKVDF